MLPTVLEKIAEEQRGLIFAQGRPAPEIDDAGRDG
jgi:hypothetical protein